MRFYTAAIHCSEAKFAQMTQRFHNFMSLVSGPAGDGARNPDCRSRRRSAAASTVPLRPPLWKTGGVGVLNRQGPSIKIEGYSL